MSHQDSTSNKSEITEEDNISQSQRVLQAMQPVNLLPPPRPPPPPPPLPRLVTHPPQQTHKTRFNGQKRLPLQEFTALPLKETGGMTSLSTESGGNINHEDNVTIFVAYNGHWEYDGKEWFFENSRSSTIFVSKNIALFEITRILHEQLRVSYRFRLKLEVHYRIGSPWFPVTEIQNDKDLWVFILETSKTKLPLCVTRLNDEFPNVVQDKLRSHVDEERRKDSLTLFIAYNGKWEFDGKEWFFKNSQHSTIFVNKNITLAEITNFLYEYLEVDKKFYRLNLWVHYRTGSPWFPVTPIFRDEDLSVFISENSKTRHPLCVTRVLDRDAYAEVARERRKDDIVENRLLKAIRKNDWQKARDIVNKNEVTWTSKLDDEGNTAFHFAVGRYKDNEIVREIVTGINNKLLVATTVNIYGQTPLHTAAGICNTEALKMMLESNPKCLFIPDLDGDLAIHGALAVPAIETFLYLFNQMQSYKTEFQIFLRGKSGLHLLGQVIDTGLIDVAYELIKDYPSMATQAYDDITPLDWIIAKPDIFYSGTNYNLCQRFVYRHVPIENNSLGSTDTADEENQETPKKDKFVTKNTRRCLYDVPHVKRLKDDKVKHNTTIKLLRRICKEADKLYTASDIKRLYSSPLYLAVENNTPEAIDVLTTYFTELFASKKDGHNIYQLTVLNRSEKVYVFLMNHKRDAKTDLSKYKDDDGNNILHLAGRLAPIHKLNATSGAALQMQQELQWFKEVKKVVRPTLTRELNKNRETPIMVFRREHKKLRKDGEEWMKKTADAYTITAALIITIVFAAAITIPGGNDSGTGKPIYQTKASLIIFAISDAISLFTSTTSLLLSLSILTARYADEDFLYKLPKRLIIGLVMLFVSVTSMMIAFGATLYIMFGQEKQWILIPIGALACLPITSFVTLQFPLLLELISSTYGPGIFAKKYDHWQSSASANKKKRA